MLAERLLFRQEVFRIDTGLPQDGTQCTFRHVSGMVGNGGLAIGLRVVPDFMASGRLSIEGKPGKPPHFMR